MGIYRQSSVGDRLHQGEILTGLLETRLKLDTLRNGIQEAELIKRPFAVVLTQDCDLEGDHRQRQAEGATRRSDCALLCEAYTEAELRNPNTTPGINNTLWTNIRQNKNERFQYLREVEPADDHAQEGFGPLVLDFKSIFTVPLDELYWRIETNSVKRRVILELVYRDHLASRVHFFHQRVGLPEEHFLKQT